MITKNGKKLFGTIDTSAFSLLCIDGIDSGVSPKNDWFNYNLIIVGSGSSSPTTNDYILENRINNLTLIASDTSTPSNYSSYMYSSQATYKNNTEQNITVREIGATVAWATGDNNRCLIIREVLDAPVVIKPQKSYTFSITV